jgi:ABC-2 type transport system ATP-binding protein
VSLQVTGIEKTYPNGIKALKGIDLTLAAGEVFGLVGPNGAGKSTLLKTVAGLLQAEAGTVRFHAEDVTGKPQEAARYIGLMPDPLGVYTDITSHDYLEFFARVLEIPEEIRADRIQKVVEELELGPWMNEEVETLSAGWQRRLALGRILLAESPVLLLDEPAAGLDISARRELLEIVRRLAGNNRAIIVSSHILPELEDLADRFGIIDQGAWREVQPGKVFFTRQELSMGWGAAQINIRCDQPERALELATLSGAKALQEDHGIRVTVDDGDAQVAHLLAALIQDGLQVYEATRLHTGLNEVVMNVLAKLDSGETSS